MLIMIHFKISMTIKKGGSGRTIKEYNGKVTDGLAGLIESKKNEPERLLCSICKIPMTIKRKDNGRVVDEYNGSV